MGGAEDSAFSSTTAMMSSLASADVLPEDPDALVRLHLLEEHQAYRLAMPTGSVSSSTSLRVGELKPGGSFGSATAGSAST